jgi:hypothetical protein
MQPQPAPGLSTSAPSMPAPDATDPDRTGASLGNLGDVIFPCLEAVGARSVVEIGASHGDFTRELLSWAEGVGADIIAVDPTPAPELLELAQQRPELELVRGTSQEALGQVPQCDALIIDGDHNYYTVGADLRLVDERLGGPGMPLLVLHDLGWPHGRRDRYYDAERIPEADRQPLARDAHLDPENPGVADGGFYFECVAAQEGGPRNGVLTAVEDFLVDREDLRLAIVPAFFGLGLLWHREAPWADAAAKTVAPWDRSPLLSGLEANRCLKLVESARFSQRLDSVQQELESVQEHLDYAVGRMNEEEERRVRYEEVLRSLLHARAFAWGEQLSRLRQRGEPAFSREQLRRVLGEEEGA